jgi:hypothetical protein
VAAPHLFEQRVDAERIAPDEEVLDLVDDGDGLHAAVHALANAGDARVCFYLHPQVHAVTAGRRRLNRRDFHELDLLLMRRGNPISAFATHEMQRTEIGFPLCILVIIDEIVRTVKRERVER